MSVRTHYERLLELHTTLTEQATAMVDEDDREALAVVLRVARGGEERLQDARDR